MALMAGKRALVIGAGPSGLSAAYHADDAGAADARHHLVAAELAQAVGDDAGGAVDVVLQLRVLVEVMAPGGHFVGEGGDAVDDGHGEDPFLLRRAGGQRNPPMRRPAA